IVAGAVHGDVVQRREALAPEEVDGTQVKYQLSGDAGMALDVVAERAAVRSIDVAHHGDGDSCGRETAHRKCGPAAALHFVRERRIRAVYPDGADVGHCRSPKSC